jgi:hypothetical protein
MNGELSLEKSFACAIGASQTFITFQCNADSGHNTHICVCMRACIRPKDIALILQQQTLNGGNLLQLAGEGGVDDEVSADPFRDDTQSTLLAH